MKLAFVTDDETTISAHFGRAAYYLVVTLEDGKETGRERREKLSHAHFASEPHGLEIPGQPHGFDAAAQGRHGRMMETIADCQILVARGMGAGAYENLKTRGIQPILTEIHTIDEAVKAYLLGNLVDRPERLH
ncbi:MAG: NifB/NifX family molybdenum-iron cluster-binding protein [Chloroflexota bacterium]